MYQIIKMTCMSGWNYSTPSVLQKWIFMPMESILNQKDETLIQ